MVLKFATLLTRLMMNKSHVCVLRLEQRPALLVEARDEVDARVRA